MSQRRSIVAILLILAVLGLAAMARGDATAVDNLPGTSPTDEPDAITALASSRQAAQGPTDPAELEAFLDALLAQEMEEYHIAGAAIAVVKDGQVTLTKGYGYADVEKGIPVDPEQTIFRVGSVGKIFTWTAVMQLAEQGKLDLDEDINTYLDFRVPDTFPQPITLKHLMTHTSGFEDRWFGSAVSDPADVVPERDWFVSHMWARIHPPGYAGYSNFNAMLAGYIVARVSGQSYADYIQDHILDPLGMTHSTAALQLPPELRPLASLGYMYDEGTFRPLTDYVGQPAALPSGGHRASIADMARFMIAHLQDGDAGDAGNAGAHILQETTAQQMHSTLYTPDARIAGTAYGLFDWSENGLRTLGHSGYSPPMHSVLLLMPDQNLGVFVNYNSDGGGALTNQHTGFQRAFFDHYYPAPPIAPAQPVADLREQAGRVVGSYSTINAYTTLVKLGGLFGAGYPATISDAGDGELLFSLEGYEGRFVEVEPLYFRQLDGPFSLVFREDNRGQITHLFSDIIPQYAEVKLEWYETPAFNMALLLACVVLFISTIPVAAVLLLRARGRTATRKPSLSGARAAYGMMVGIAVLNLLLLAGVALTFPAIMQNILLPPPLAVKIALGFGVVAAVMTVGALLYTVLAWKNSYGTVAGRAYYTLLTVAAVAYIWFLNYWNLLGWRY